MPIPLPLPLPYSADDDASTASSDLYSFALEDHSLPALDSFAFQDDGSVAMFTSIAKLLYRHAKAVEEDGERFGALDTIPKGLDLEQIWAVLDDRLHGTGGSGMMQWAKDGLDELEEALAGIDAIGDGDAIEVEESGEDSVSHSDDESDSEDASDESEAVVDVDTASDVDISDSPSSDNIQPNDADEVSSEPDSEEEALDDGFFSMREMEKFADRMERASDEERSDEDDSEEIDYTQDPDELRGSDSEGGSDDENMEDNANEIRFADFFRPPRSSIRGSKPTGAQRAARAEKRVQFAEKTAMTSTQEFENDYYSDTAAGNDKSSDKKADLFRMDDHSDSDKDSGTHRSGFEKRQEKMQATIKELEAERIEKKEWTMTGEASAHDRPQNSLLEQNLEFDHANKTVPVVTVEKTNTLEDIIKARILNGLFDDVVRKRDPKEKPFRSSERVEIDEEKSKKSLAEIYEAEFIKQQAPALQPGTAKNETIDPVLQKQHDEITQLARTLFHKLDALSSHHHRAELPEAEIRIIRDVSAIEMEEAIPIAVTDGSRLAPHEVYQKPRGDVRGKSEMEQEERRRVRNRKKRVAKVRQVAKGEAGGQADVEKAKDAAVKSMVKVINKDGSTGDKKQRRAKAE